MTSTQDIQNFINTMTTTTTTDRQRVATAKAILNVRAEREELKNTIDSDLNIDLVTKHTDLVNIEINLTNTLNALA